MIRKGSIDLEGLLQEYPGLAEVRCADVKMLLGLSEQLSMVRGRERYRDPRDRCNCRATMEILRETRLAFHYPGEPSRIRPSLNSEVEALSYAVMVCERCGMRYPIHAPFGTGVDRVKKPKEMRVVRFLKERK